MGLAATALAAAGVAGPLVSGLLVQHLGFHFTFYTFAILAALGAAVFTKFMPETRPGGTNESTGVPNAAIAAPEVV